MPVCKVSIKWCKEVYKDLELNTDEPPMVFKAQLFALTGVQPERQKLVIKGNTIKDDEWGSVTIKDGMTLLLMGTRDEQMPSAPHKQTVFIEDLSENELATALELPAGLTNLGNTCYMNATVQCLRTVPELKNVLKNHPGGLSLSNDNSQSITSALRDLYEAMDKSATIAPLILLQVLHNAFPRFAEKEEHGGFVQQDANECWTEMMRMLKSKLKPDEGAHFSSFIDQYFGGTFRVEMKCIESDVEPVMVSTEDFLQLSCFITTEVKYMQAGLKSRLQETIEKMSPTLGRDSHYLKSSKICRLPAYLTVQFVRFEFKGRAAVNAKILKDVKFPLSLDVFELCTEDLQQKLIPMRNKMKVMEEKQLAEAHKKKTNATPTGDQLDQESKKKFPQPYSFPEDPGSNNSGFYELQAVLTHKGRSSSSGHYLGWVKRKDSWFKCDDDQVTPISVDEILRLSGGGDWHCAYVLLYGPRILELDEETMQSPASVTN